MIKQCKDKSHEKWKANREKNNAKRREEYYQETLEREQRLDDINERLKADIAELDKENGNKRTD